MASVFSVVVGDLKLVAPPAWLFRELSGLFVARRDGGVGTLQISTAYRRDLPEGASGEAAEQLARQWVDDPVASFDSLQGGAAPIGMGELVNDHGSIWYSRAPGGLLLAMYQAKEAVGDPVQIEGEREEVTAIVRSARWRVDDTPPQPTGGAAPPLETVHAGRGSRASGRTRQG